MVKKRLKRRHRRCRKRQRGGIMGVVYTQRGENKRNLSKREQLALDPYYAAKIFLESYVDDKMF